MSFDLAQEGARLGDPGVLALGLGLGATAYFALNRMLARPRRRGNEAAANDDGGTELALGTFLDGAPSSSCLESASRRARESVSRSLVAIFFQPPGGDRLVRRDARRGNPTGGDPSALDVRRAGLHRVRQSPASTAELALASRRSVLLQDEISMVAGRSRFRVVPALMTRSSRAAPSARGGAPRPSLPQSTSRPSGDTLPARTAEPERFLHG
ncbi:MAG: hypothetical protein ACXW3P_06215 [Rhodospirillales bacterium]